MLTEFSNFSHPAYPVLLLGLGLVHLFRIWVSKAPKKVLLWPGSFAVSGIFLLAAQSLELTSLFASIPFFLLALAPSYFIADIVVSHFDRFGRARKGLPMRASLLGGVALFSLAQMKGLFWVEVFFIALIIIYLILLMITSDLDFLSFLKTSAGLLSMMIILFLITALIFSHYHMHLGLLFHAFSLIILLRFPLLSKGLINE